MGALVFWGVAMKEQIVLPADVFDTYELSCEAYGGIGADHQFDGEGRPLCVWGHAVAAVDFIESPLALLNPFADADGIWTTGNDVAIRELIGEIAANRGDRVSWADYCAHRGIVRGA